MKKLLLKDIVKITNGNLLYGNENEELGSFSINTKTIKKGEVFLGVKGEKVDGSTFYEQAFDNGAIGCILNKNSLNDVKEFENKFILEVDDTVKAIQKIAKFKRDLYEDIIVVGVTGSVGKTSTKDIISSVLSQKYKVLKTEGNYNNELGLPLTILKVIDEEALVLEMGMDGIGQISLLSKIARPKYGVITNVGTAHIGILGSRENILKAKLEMLDGLDKDGRLFINNDNDMLHMWEEKKLDDRVVTFGIHNKSDFEAKNIKYDETTTFECNENDYSIKVGGEAFIYNALSAISIGTTLGIDTNLIKKGIENVELTKNRLQLIERDGYTIISDCYNANFDSMKEGLSNLSKYKDRRRIAVLGDMLELGEYSKELHTNVGKEVVKTNVDILITVGEESKYIASEAKDKVEVHEFNSNKEAIDFINSIIKKNDIILVKASNGMKFTEIVENI
ncbi:MAG: UDP-N-acetylmuramoyl-tripeptide--D-alanyl-D-alanine ligase [Bacilli bacterium]|nr:UDP-N-acetylmuramoyl-tripeptide--D-alanyl-D-alanine ligase [Bacilli bacterium]